MFFTDSKVALARQEGLTSYPAVTGSCSRTVIHDLLDAMLSNPPGQLIHPGDSVVLKPNWVMHNNSSGQGTDCLITNPSVITAVLDYVLRASPGKVIVGDAPIQGCNLDRLMQEGGYMEIKEQS